MNEQNSQKIIIGVLTVVVIGLLGLLVFSSPNTATTEDQNGKLTFSETDWEMGDISMANGLSIKEIPVTNNTSSTVTISNMETTCMCTSAQIIHENGSKSGIKGMPGHGGTSTLSETIAPNEKATIKVIFDPNAHGPEATGPIDRSIFLTTTSSEQPSIELSFSGNVTK